ncbi:alpha/beta hydrolase [Mesorhizobium sp. M2D.F.Ca.ET.185.01.1.1]|uniref:alpha/beta hydrolase n=1 Tax=unclassified Mesorhizobium TaxID=325217 RepID=UPI000FCBA813|nr:MULTISPECIES: alpha/beta hydrolase [unclassified Mesorhizobium]TGP50855.1 alpha/beta hydrolase [bacterium M00.F.Ca.ET.230.01.1.1]TGP77317.1 alpha/beta hydrolase [bacterium M00.F.Ca.ET.227.01.1.1]TGP93111.1 alpha/beta hydrolase [bacterium M00.F.Ca.ET.222.01.1.1]TGP96657.1 alpha/beta hydrolase [bacterium M00.F.Ca.ET.221.01.1.1]TGU20712.1 alpha/beta hydrolase [bacterium M00.F.Ca.ET.156.01.1.1]TGU49869.1 alpha/beta hydrolase [bacterium M00.F.Ca.ET.146.01.1.1]TGV68735.1 alpha/beta hydrolase [M
MPFFETAHGKSYYRCWDARKAVGGVVFLHGFGEQSGHYHRLAGAFNASGLAMWALDQQGHGLSYGERGAVASMDPLVDNAERLISIAASEAPGLPLVLVGHSLGGIAAALLIARGERRCLGLAVTGTLIQPETVAIPAPPEVTRDPFYLDMLATDPFAFSVTPESTAARRAAMHKARGELAATLPKVDLPVLLINGDHDVIAPARYARAVRSQLKNATVLIVKDGFHDIINDVPHFAVERRLVAFARAAINGRGR